MKELVRIVSEDAGIEITDMPDGIEVIKRDGCKILLNHNENNVDTGIKGMSLISDSEFDGVLEGYGVEFIKEVNE